MNIILSILEIGLGVAIGISFIGFYLSVYHQIRERIKQNKKS